jgi:dsDNA-specific endonuclease/ATPase MutS2
MKLTCYLAVAATTLALMGCSNNNDQTGANTGGAVSGTNSMEQAKDDFLASMNQKMKDLDAGIDALSEKSKEYTGDAKVQADKSLAQLHEQRAALSNKYDALKQTTAAGWDEAKAGFQTAWDDLQKAYDSAKAKFS